MLDCVIIERYFYNFREGLFDELKRQGLNFKLINSTKSRGRVKVHQDKVDQVNYIRKPISFNINDNIVVFPFLIFTLFALSPMVIITEGGQNTINNLQVKLYCWLTRKKYIVWDLGKGYQDFENSFPRRLYMVLYIWIAKGGKYIFGYNSSSKKYFKSIGIHSEKIVVLNNTVDTVALKKVMLESSSDMPDDLSEIFRNDEIYAIFVGTLLPTKNIESFAEIFKRLGDKYHLLIIGDGRPDYVNDLKNKFKDINCNFLGYKRPEELLPYYKVASFAILPGLGGLAINQAMAFGVCVLCSIADGAEVDLVHNGQTGYIYTTINDLVTYIQGKSIEEWAEMGKNAYNLLYSEFSIESECDRFIKHVNSCMK